jgi:Putative serine esterase (DUF676)
MKSTDSGGLMQISYDSGIQSDTNLTYVFLHGIDGAGMSAWAESNSLQDFLPSAVGRTMQTREIFLKHDFKTFSGRKEDRQLLIEDAADRLYSVLSGCRISSPVVYICHSLGGVLFKKCYIHSVLMGGTSIFHNTVTRISKVVFLATPHFGSTLASSAYGLFRINATSALRDLRLNSRVLKNLNNEFLRAIQAHSPDAKIVTFIETRGVTIAEARLWGLRHVPLLRRARLLKVLGPNQSECGGETDRKVTPLPFSHVGIAKLDMQDTNGGRHPVIRYLVASSDEDRRLPSSTDT